jgi:starch phosphorylase
MLGAERTFREINAGLWLRSYHNPRKLIESVSPARLRQLGWDPGFVARVDELGATLDADLKRPYAALSVTPERPTVYFCSEFAIHCSLPLYGGGLGVLAGDLLKAASDMAFPMVGVGLLYREGYFHQRLDVGGWQHEYWTPTDFTRVPASLVTDEAGRPVDVEIEIRGRKVLIQIWRVDVGRVPLYLLDTDREENHPIDRWITARLYIGDRHTRLAQYAVLGVGGVRALTKLGIKPGIVHLNEGHAALSGFERIRALIAEGRSFEDALAAVRAETVFTTHTPVAAGNEWYSPDEVEPVLGQFVNRVGIAPSEFYDLGRLAPGNASEPISITPLALRMSHASNAVSRRHGEVAREMWRPLWPDRAVENVPIGYVTNGVHTTTWMAEPMQSLLNRHLGADWQQRLADPSLWDRIAAIPDEQLWKVRRQLRSELIAFARNRSVVDRLSRGEAPEYVEAAARVFDPDALTIGFARRVATYKRLHLLTWHLDRGLRLLADQKRPVQMVIAGKAHPQDEEAKQTLRALLQLRHTAEVGSRIVFLEDYELQMASSVVAGVDVWLNLPRPPLEASGTSGMKVALNGGLNLSVLDGWWIEGYDGEDGWGISTPAGDAQMQDDRDASALFDLLENEVVPLFYERDAGGIAHRWLARVKASMRRLIPMFSAERMLRDYSATIYDALPVRPAGERPV